ncbi:MAG: Ribonuclease 3 [Holosporales bacterium]
MDYFKFNNGALLEAALTHPSYRAKKNSHEFEMLSCIGAQVLNLVLTEELVKRYPGDGRQNYLRKIDKLLFKDVRRAVFIKIEGEKVLKADPLELKMLTSYIFAEACEAYIGALYIDQGIKHVAKFIKEHWQPYIEGKFKIEYDYKQRLDEWVNRSYQEHPIYKVVRESEINFPSLMAVEVSLPQRKSVIGYGPSQSLAQKSAALSVLRELNLI